MDADKTISLFSKSRGRYTVKSENIVLSCVKVKAQKVSYWGSDYKEGHSVEGTPN